MRVRLVLIAFLLVCMIQLARANASFGLALEMFDYAYWWPYVLAMIVLEAWMIGRRLGDGWLKAVSISILANAVTAGCCPMCCSSAHGALVGSGINPNPFLNALALFSLFGFVSAMIEGAIWKLRRTESTSYVLGRSLLAHAVGVPVALAILLIPARPYKGLEWTAGGARHRLLRAALDKYVHQSYGDPRGLPAMSDASDFVEHFGSRWDGGYEPEAWAAAYLPDYHRFDFGEARRHPIEWNSQSAGLLVEPDSEIDEAAPAIWLLRVKQEDTYWGFALDAMSGKIEPFSGKTAAQLDAEAKATLKVNARIRLLQLRLKPVNRGPSEK